MADAMRVAHARMRSRPGVGSVRVGTNMPRGRRASRRVCVCVSEDGWGWGVWAGVLVRDLTVQVESSVVLRYM